MVATISPLHGGNATYYTKSYHMKGQVEGEWLDTRAAAELGLAGEPVRPRDFERLLLGFRPDTDEKLVQNAGTETRQLGWDVQFGLHKSFSALAALVPEARDELESCLREAVRDTVVEVVEAHFLESRRGQGGGLREAVSSPVAAFIHRTNRENEIHLHCHAAVPNVGIRPDGTSGTLVSWNLYEAKLALGKAFHARFAELATARLGIECEFDEHGLSRVKGFPEHVAEAMSTPSRKIAEATEDTTAKAKEEANLRIRSPKGEVPFGAVVEGCRRTAAELGFSEDDARAFLGRAPRPEQGPADEAARSLLREVVAGLPEKFSKPQLFEAAFREGARAVLPTAAVTDAIRETLSDGLEPVGRDGRKELFRGVEGPGPAAAAPGPGEAGDEKLREFLGRIIEATPELAVAEFLPAPEPEPPFRPEAVDAGQILARSLDEAVAEVARSSSPLAENPGARDALKEAVRAEVESPSAHDARLFEGISVDTTSIGLGFEAGPATGFGVDEAGGLPEEARSLLGRAVDAAKDRYVQGLAEAVITQALEELTRHEAHFSRKELARAVDRTLSGVPVSPSLVDEVIARTLSDPNQVVSLGTYRGSDRYTTPEMLRVEQDGLAAAKALQERSGHAEDRGSVERRLGRSAELTTEQREAAIKAVTGNDLVLINAGNGLEMHAVQRGIREALGRKDVLWVAPTATAARELEKSVGAEQVITLQHLLGGIDRGLGEAVKHRGQMLVNAALGRPTWDAPQLKLTSGTTVVLDSASLANTRQFSRLLQHAAAADARLIACGTHDMPALGPGGLFRELRQSGDPTQLVSLAGKPKGQVDYVPLRDREEAKDALIDVWSREAMKKPEDHTIVAATSTEVRELNARAQARRKEAGLLGYRSLEVRYQQGGETVKERIYEGDRVVFTARTANETVTGVFGTVKHIDLITGRVKVGLDLKEKKHLPWEFERQKTVEFQYRKYRFFQRQEEGFRLGYAATIYRSQNVAVEGNSYCLVGGPDGGAPSAVYAGLALAKGTTYFFDDQTAARPEDLREKQTAHAVLRAAREEMHEEVAPSAKRSERQEQDAGFSMGF